MTTDALYLPRKKVRSFERLFGSLLLLLPTIVMFQPGEPAPAIAISRATTYITEPLRPDGLPDYEKHVLELYRGDAAPENNAAVPLLQALFPSELDPAPARAVVAELGMEEAPSASDVVEPVDSKVNQAALWRWLVPRWPNQRNFSDVDAWAERMTGQAVWRPWTSEQMPPMSNWLAKNKKPLDLIVEASRRPRYFAPSLTLINNTRDLLVKMSFPQQNNMLILLARSIHEGC